MFKSTQFFRKHKWFEIFVVKIYLQFVILVVCVCYIRYKNDKSGYFQSLEVWKFFRTSIIFSNIPCDFSRIISIKFKTLLKRSSLAFFFTETSLESTSSFSSCSWKSGTEKSFIIIGVLSTLHFFHSLNKKYFQNVTQ